MAARRRSIISGKYHGVQDTAGDAVQWSVGAGIRHKEAGFRRRFWPPRPHRRIGFTFEHAFYADPGRRLLAMLEVTAVYLSAYKEIVSCRCPGNLSNSLVLPSGESGRLNRDHDAVSGTSGATLEERTFRARWPQPVARNVDRDQYTLTTSAALPAETVQPLSHHVSLK